MPTASPALQGFIRWCLDERERLQTSLGKFETGEMRFHASHGGGPLKDISEQHMADLRSSIAELDGVIAKFGEEYGDFRG